MRTGPVVDQAGTPADKSTAKNPAPVPPEADLQPVCRWLTPRSRLLFSCNVVRLISNLGQSAENSTRHACPNNMWPIVISFAVVLGSFLLIGLSAHAQRRPTTNDYLMADRNVHPWLVGFATASTNSSGFMFIGL